jgi:hypothetical protein
VPVLGQKPSNKGDGLEIHPRPFYVAKVRSLDLDAWVGGFCNVSDLGTDMLAFSITVGPDEKHTASWCMELDVIGYRLMFLGSTSALR